MSNKLKARSCGKEILTAFEFALSDFKSKYAGSVFGFLWAIAEPLVTVAIYRFVYGTAFGQNSVDGIPYYIWLAVGIAPWFFISDGLNGICSVYRDYSYMVKKMSFDKKILPVVRGISSFISHLMFAAVVILAVLISGNGNINCTSLIVMEIVSFFVVVCTGRILALFCGYFKDIKNVLGVILNIGFWLTPVFWNISSVGDDLRKYAELNPAALICEGYREALLFGGWISAKKLLYLASMCLVLYIVGKFSEKKLLGNIADML